jgi:hypothetical protein
MNDPTTTNPIPRSVANLRDPTFEWPLEEVFPLVGRPDEGRAPQRLPPISGTYRGSLNRALGGTGGAPEILELRVDVDRLRPLKLMSGDLYLNGTTGHAYVCSFAADVERVERHDKRIDLCGQARFSVEPDSALEATRFRRLRVEVTLADRSGGHLSAQVKWCDDSDVAKREYSCTRVSESFRRVEVEVDYTGAASPKIAYEMDKDPDLTKGKPYKRSLTLQTAYREAGVELAINPATDPIEIDPDVDKTGWDDAELQNAMEENFSRWKGLTQPAWCVWLFVAGRYHRPGVHGLMFDQQVPLPRQGCVVFRGNLAALSDNSELRLARLQLFYAVHELGHCFNLRHAFGVTASRQPVPSRRLTWMNYHDNYPSGPTIPADGGPFFEDFAFRFEDEELRHLRHGAWRDVVPGGNYQPGVTSGLSAPAVFTMLSTHPSLRLEAWTSRPSFAFGEPVVVELKLGLAGERRAAVHRSIHPRMGFVTVAIRKPDGRTTVYQPLLDYCVESDTGTLSASDPAVFDSAYVGYGKDGFYFDQVGFYDLRAMYRAEDGQVAASEAVRIRVRQPMSPEDEELADCFFDDKVGRLLYLLGSNAQALRGGADRLDYVLSRYADHPLATYAGLVQGVAAGRKFKSVTRGKVIVGKRDYGTAVSLLQRTVNAPPDSGLDNITVNFVFRYLASMHKDEHNQPAFDATLTQMRERFRSQRLKGYIMDRIDLQVQALKSSGAPLRY